MRSLYVILILLITTACGLAQVIISPGDLHTPEQVVCTACPPERLPEIKIVDPSGGGDFLTIKDAVIGSQPGWIILVKDGTYNRRVGFYNSGTASQRIVLKNYPGHSPVYDCTGSPDPLCRIEINENADYITIQGLEIRESDIEGIKIDRGDYFVVKDNHIHNNGKQGILVVNSSNGLIEGNTIDYNGTAPGHCGDNPKLCHGIYFSDFLCTPMTGNIVRNNTITRHGGRGIQFNHNGCATQNITDTIIENNELLDNSWGIVFFYTGINSQVRNNIIKAEVRPNTTDTDWFMVALYGVQNNTFENNIFYSTLPDMEALRVNDTISIVNSFNHNVWSMEYYGWRWEGLFRTDFLGYQQVSGWDAQGAVMVKVEN